MQVWSLDQDDIFKKSAKIIIEIFVLRLFCVLKFLTLENKTIFFKSGHVRAINMDRLKYCNDYIKLVSLKPRE